MKQLYWLVFLGLATLCAAQSNPEDEIPTFNLDDYYVVPKFTMSIGARVLTGSKATFGGSGQFSSTQNVGDVTSTGVVRNYHDGTIGLDARTDSEGNQIDPGDGKSNQWTFVDLNQVVNDGTDIAFHSYTAQVTDTATHRKDSGPSLGTELVLARDMGKIGKKIEWKLFAGISVNSISARSSANVAANIITLTDLYSLNGQTPPTTAPYNAPSTAVVGGTVVDTTILIGQRPDSRTITTAPGTVHDIWKVKGTYVTLRMGPSVYYSFSDNLRLSVSAGPTLTYAGTTYSVDQTLTPATSDDITSTVSDTSGATLTGYYVDTTLEYLINDRAGLYAGAFYQSNGDYNQNVTENSATYTTTIDLSQLEGFRAGLNFKF